MPFLQNTKIADVSGVDPSSLLRLVRFFIIFIFKEASYIIMCVEIGKDAPCS